MQGLRLFLFWQICFLLAQLVFGWQAAFDLSSLNGATGTVLNGMAQNDATGFSVAGAGDVNGDGVDDFCIGAYWADAGAVNNAGVVYVVFGIAAGSQFPNSFDLSTLDGTNGFAVEGFEQEAAAGISVSTAGDVNGDGVADVIIGAYQANPSGREWAGEAYIVFGRPQGTSFPSVLLLSSLDGANGFAISGVAAFDSAGISVSNAGDVNKDGLDDVLVGAHYADPTPSLNEAGKAFIIYGSTAAFSTPLFLSTLDGTNGFEIQGIGAEDYAGVAAAAGDVNSDGIADIIVGAWFGGSTRTGEAFVIFGLDHMQAPFPHPFLLSSLDGTNGFRFTGAATGDALGVSVSSAGDVNGDGIDDLVVGAQHADPNGVAEAGAAYIIFGIKNTSSFPSPFSASSINGNNGVEIQGIAANDNAGWSVSGAGDINADGAADVVIGAHMADSGGVSNTGTAYVVFGVDAGGSLAHPLLLSTLRGDDNGVAIPGLAAGDFAGFAVSGAGDVNSDGIDDLLVGAHQASPGGLSGAGSVYLIMGAKAPVDECALGSHNCQQGCQDTSGSFLCICGAGYQLQGDAISCADQDECTLSTDNCHPQAACNNSVGSFSCICDAGTTPNADSNPNSPTPGDGSACFPVDECQYALDNCDVRAACNDTAGSFDCVCNVGYEGSGVTCTDVPECTRGLSQCDAKADCVETDGSFSCNCQTGYRGSGLVCSDVNECCTGPNGCTLPGNNTCHEAATCTNTPGSYSCECPSGWNSVGAVEGEDCVNPLACDAAEEATCDDNARCDKTSLGASTFECNCNLGYQGPGENCTDINECGGAQTNTCDDDAVCTNTAGSFFCTCREFYIDVDLSATPGVDCEFNACDVSEAALCHEFATCAKNKRGEVVCSCIEGYIGDGIVCLDVDECSIPSFADNCHPVALCLNTRGSFYCECPPSVLGDGLLCSEQSWLIRSVFNLPAGANQDVHAVAEQYKRLLLPNGRSTPVELRTVARPVGDQLTLYEAFNTEKEAVEVLGRLTSPDWSSVGGGALVDGPDIVWWTSNVTESPLPPHMRLLSVEYDGSCNGNQGCWQIDVGYTAHGDAISSVFLPRMASTGRREGSDALLGQTASDSDRAAFSDLSSGRRSAAVWDTLPLLDAFPCERVELNAAQASPANTACCLPSIPAAYRASVSLSPALASLDLTAPACSNISFATAGVAPNPLAGVLPIPQAPPPLRGGLFVGGSLEGLALSSTEPRGVLNPLHEDHKVHLQLHEPEAASLAGVSLSDTAGVVRAVETFVGLAELRAWPATTILHSTVSQAFLHLERSPAFAVALHSDRPHSAVGYVTLRLVDVQQLGGSGSPSAHFVQVSWYVDEAFREPAGGSVLFHEIEAAFGQSLSDPTTRRNMVRACREYAACRRGTCAPAAGPSGVFSDAEFSSFSALVDQQCASHAQLEMCGGESASPVMQGRYATFNIPLGVDRLPPVSSGEAGRVMIKVPVRMTASSGQEVESEMTATVEIRANSIHRLCDDASAAAPSLADVATTSLLVGSVSSSAEFDEIVKTAPGSNLRSDVVAQQTPLVVPSLGIEFGVFTLVAEGTGAPFEAPSNGPRPGIALEDMITLHILEVTQPGAAAATGPKADAVKALLSQESPAAADLPAGASALSGALYVTTDAQLGRARLHPTSALLSLCPAQSPAPSAQDMFPESCVLRRDVVARQPAATALELPRPGLGGALSPAPQGDEQHLQDFMSALLGDNDNSRALATDWTRLMHERYRLDGVSRRAWWVNPGYTWAPRAEGSADFETQFDLSQTVFMFALMSLDETPGVDGRRVLLASLPSGPPTLGLSAASVTFPASPAQLVAKEVNVPLRQVSTWSMRMGLSWEEQCAEERAAKLSLVDKIWAAMEGKVITVQVPTIRRFLVPGVCCPVSNCSEDSEAGRRDNHGGSTDAYAELGVVLAHDGASPHFYVDEVLQAESMTAIETVDVHESVRLSRQAQGDVTDDEADAEWRYWTQHTALVATVCTLTAIGCLVCIFFGWYWKRRQDRKKAEAKEEDEEDEEAAETREVSVGAGQLVIKNESLLNPYLLPYDNDRGDAKVSHEEKTSGLDLMVYGKPATLKDKAAGPAKVRYTKGPEVL